MFETMEVRMMNIRFRKGCETSFGEDRVCFFLFLFFFFPDAVSEVILSERNFKGREKK